MEIDDTRNKTEMQDDETRDRSEIHCLLRLCGVVDLKRMHGMTALPISIQGSRQNM